ncbi:MAG TPA: hypothetical protein VFF06_16015 [Polyangia bacterium]|nr:hypothetical protein [Polyangia bacterium]
MTAGRYAAAALALVALTRARPAGACAACACGDSTLTTVGVEKPYRNRIRFGLEERLATLSTGDGVMNEQSTVLRSSLSAAWSPHARLQLMAMLPWFDSWIHSATGGAQQLNGLGDLEGAARVLLFRERRFAPQHLLWATAGVKMPTGPRLRDGAGYPYADDDQPGSGSWDPFGGVSYGWFGGLTSIFAATNYRYTTTGPRGHRFGSTLTSSATLQLQPYPWGALQLGADVRWSQADSLPNGVDAPNTGGTVLYASPALLASPWMNVLIRIGAQIPAVQRLNGVQSEGAKVMLSLAYDLR